MLRFSSTRGFQVSTKWSLTWFVALSFQSIVVAQVVPCDTSTIAYWGFDSDYTDYCGTIDGSAVGSASIAASGCAPLPGNSGCLVLNGDPSRVDLPAPFNPTHTTPLAEGTIEAWVDFQWVGEGGYAAAIFNHGIAASYTDLAVVIRALPTGGFAAAFNRPLATYPDIALPWFDSNTWHHVAWTWNGTETRTYLDGALVGKQPATVAIPFTGDEAEIGSDDQELGYWVGRLDEVRLSNRVLSPSEFVGSPAPLVPTVSVWGLAVLALLILIAGTVAAQLPRTARH